MKHLALTLLLLATTALAAQDKSMTRASDLPPPPDPPAGYKGAPASDTSKGAPPPDTSSDEEGLEPEVTITTHGTDQYEEYRYHGQLYMIKVTPKHGIPYYLIDEEGRGQFHRSELQPDVKVPMWVIKRF